MKKTNSIVLIDGATVTAGWNFSQTQNEVELSDLVLGNVEALGNDELSTSPNPYIASIYLDRTIYGGIHTVIYCSPEKSCLYPK